MNEIKRQIDVATLKGLAVGVGITLFTVLFFHFLLEG